MRYAIALLAIVATGCVAAKDNPTVNAKAEEQAIRRLDQEWGAAADKKDIATAVAFYAPDGVAAWPDEPAAIGTENIRAAWKAMAATPGLTSVKFFPETIQVSSAGDMATDYGRVEVGIQTDKGPITAVSKYLVVWKKVDGDWKVAYDMFNSNAPAPKP